MKGSKAKAVVAGCMIGVIAWGQKTDVTAQTLVATNSACGAREECQRIDLTGQIDDYSIRMEKMALQEQESARAKIEKQQFKTEENREKTLQKNVWKKRARSIRIRKLREQKRKIKACLGGGNMTTERRILERIVEAEAGDQDQKGKILVANVILNRVQSKSFPNTIHGVVFAHRGRRYQFSPISDGNYYRVRVADSTKKAVYRALSGENFSQGALYFMERSIADSSNVNWFDRCLTRLFGYGCHEFYK